MCTFERIDRTYVESSPFLHFLGHRIKDVHLEFTLERVPLVPYSHLDKDEAIYFLLFISHIECRWR